MPIESTKWLCETCEAEFKTHDEAAACEAKDAGGPCRFCQDQRHIIGIEHPVNRVDYRGDSGSAGYQVWRCTICGEFWGQRYQYDPGTGEDDRWAPLGKDPEKVRRHY